MLSMLAEYALFFAKSLTWVAAILVVAAGLFSLARANRPHGGERLRVRNLNERLEDLRDQINDELLDEAALKAQEKTRKAEAKARRKAAKQGASIVRPRVFVLDFHGDIQASATVHLREEISALLQVARPEDEVLVRLESPGGLVHGYGLAASQLQRVRAAKLKLTVTVDKVAASGGYMMACVADRVLAAPFAVIGSVGVVAQLPNFHRLLKKHDIDFELHTAGDFKRTLTVFGENTDAGREKFREELEQTHSLFKRFVADNRPSVDVERIATGEHWYGSQALELKLVDRLSTSDDYLLERIRDCDVFELRYRKPRSLGERLAVGAARLAEALPARLLHPRPPGI